MIKFYLNEVPGQLRPPANGGDTGPLSRDPQQRKKVHEKQYRVLIVEDESLVAENLKETLNQEGYQVIEVVSSAEEAIANFSTIDPDLILMDIRLGGSMDGIDAAMLIHETLKKIPIVFLTAYPQGEFPHLVNLDPAFYSYLTKPYDVNELSDSIEKLLGK